MKDFNLDLYRGTRQYIKFFDIYIKQFEKNKETIFLKLGINNNSYRRLSVSTRHAFSLT